MERADGEPGDDAPVLDAIGRSGAALVVLDADGRVVRWTPGAERLFGWAVEDVLGRLWIDLGLAADPVRRDRAAKVLASVLTGATPAGEWVARRKDGVMVRIHTVHEPIRGDDGTPVGIVSLSFDLSSREVFEQALLREALHDELTGLPGRSLLQHQLVTLLARADAPSPRAAVLFVDLGGFKTVNDRYGHDVGDRVLVRVAERLRRAVRSADLVARVGGDEFVVLVAMEGSAAAADEVVDRASAALAEPVMVDVDGTPVGIPVSASIGLAVAGAGDDADDVVRRADAAMYRAKRG